MSDRAVSQREHAGCCTETDAAYRRMCGGSISLGGVGVGPAQHVTSKLYDGTLQAETDS